MPPLYASVLFESFICEYFTSIIIKRKCGGTKSRGTLSGKTQGTWNLGLSYYIEKREPFWEKYLPSLVPENSLRAPNSANVHEALLREMTTYVVLKLHSHSKRRLRLMMAHKLLPSYLLVKDGHFPRHGTIVSPVD